MPFDGIFIHHLCNELQCLAGTRVDKIHQPARDDLVLNLRSKGENYRFLFCVNPARARCGIVEGAIENPAQPTMLCMLLRKHLTGAAITGISQPGLERSLRFELSGYSEIGEQARYTLRADFTGRHANLMILREDGTILCQLRNAEPAPPRESYDGISPLVEREMRHRNISIEELFKIEAKPWLYGGAQFSWMQLTHLGENQGEVMESFSRLLEIFFDERDRAERTKQRTAELLKLCETRAARARRKAQAQREELARTQNRERLRVCAELIFANRAALELAGRGQETYRLENYYDDNNIIAIEADPALSPGENAGKYLKAYRKAKTAAELLGGLIARAQAEALYLDSVADLLRRADSQAEADALRYELEAQGFCKPKNAKKSVKQKPLQPIEYTSSEGLRILVGRNNTQNEQLAFKTARAGDLWFHVKGYPGSHVILCCEGKTPGEQSISEAAQAAAWHSKAQGTASVDYTSAKSLKKIAGAPPGQVIYHTHKSMTVTPTEDSIRSLQKGEFS